MSVFLRNELHFFTRVLTVNHIVLLTMIDIYYSFVLFFENIPGEYPRKRCIDTPRWGSFRKVLK